MMPFGGISDLFRDDKLSNKTYLTLSKSSAEQRSNLLLKRDEFTQISDIHRPHCANNKDISPSSISSNKKKREKAANYMEINTQIPISVHLMFQLLKHNKT